MRHSNVKGIHDAIWGKIFMHTYFFVCVFIFLQNIASLWSMYWSDPYYISKRKFMPSQQTFDVIQVPFDESQERDHDTPIKAVILHCIGLPTFLDVVQTFQKYKVSSHYIVPQMSGEEVLGILPDLYTCINRSNLPLPTLQFPEKVPVIQFLVDNKIAGHTGASYFSNWNQYYNSTDARCDLAMAKRTLNECTIGVEFHAPGYGNGDGSDWYQFTHYTNGQMETGISLLKYLKEQHKIPTAHFLAHSTIAPTRKTDPGPLFPWRMLAEHGIGYMPPIPSTEKAPLPQTWENVQTFQKHLERIGFRTDLRNSFGAFRWGAFDEETKQCLSAYTLQFFLEAWQKPADIQLTKVLLKSLESFDETMIKTSYSGK